MITPTDIKYAQKLRSLRIGLQVKQEEAAKLIGISSQQEYSKLENGKIHFEDELLSKISSAFNISVDDFINPNSNTTINSFNHSPYNSIINDKDFVFELLKTKDENIALLRELLKMKEELLTIKNESKN